MPDAMGEAASLLNRARRVLITAHEHPDGYALGSALGLARLLRGQGKEAHPAHLDPVPRRYHFLLEEETILQSLPDDWEARYDCLAVLDCGSDDRAGVRRARGKSEPPLLNLDHHETNTRFGDIDWVDPDASSVGEMICRLAEAETWDVGAAAAPLWVAIVTDTGRFSYSNTSARTLRIAADLVEAGADPARCAREVYQSRPLEEIRLEQRALERLELREDGRLASTTLRMEDFDAFGCVPEHAQDVVDLARGVRGVEAAFFFYERDAGGEVKVSVRTVPPFDAAALCRRFGGGGHPRAAGCSLREPLESARDRVLRTVHDAWFA